MYFNAIFTKQHSKKGVEKKEKKGGMITFQIHLGGTVSNKVNLM